MTTTLTKEAVVITEQTRCFDGFFKVDRLTFKHKRFDGSWTNSVAREIFMRHDAVAVLPYDPVRDEVLLIEQLRIATIDKTASPWMIELIAGLIDHKDESVTDVAMREAKEEAGIKLNSLIPIHSFFNSAGGSNEQTHLFLALCDLKNAGGIFGLAEENEDIKAFTIKRVIAMEWLASGKIENASLIIALLWLNTEYKKYSEETP